MTMEIIDDQSNTVPSKASTVATIKTTHTSSTGGTHDKNNNTSTALVAKANDKYDGNDTLFVFVHDDCSSFQDIIDSTFYTLTGFAGLVTNCVGCVLDREHECAHCGRVILYNDRKVKIPVDDEEGDVAYNYYHEECDEILRGIKKKLVENKFSDIYNTDDESVYDGPSPEEKSQEEEDTLKSTANERSHKEVTGQLPLSCREISLCTENSSKPKWGLFRMFRSSKRNKNKNKNGEHMVEIGSDGSQAMMISL